MKERTEEADETGRIAVGGKTKKHHRPKHMEIEFVENKL